MKTATFFTCSSYKNFSQRPDAGAIGTREVLEVGMIMLNKKNLELYVLTHLSVSSAPPRFSHHNTKAAPLPVI